MRSGKSKKIGRLATARPMNAACSMFAAEMQRLCCFDGLDSMAKA